MRSEVEPLVVEAAEKKQDTFHDWLSAEPARDRVRDISKCNRLQSGVAKWPMEWLDQAGVVCFERGEGRVRQERKGRPDARFMQGVVKTRELPTAVANAADHYVVLEPDKRILAS